MGKWIVAALLLVVMAVQVEAAFAASTGFSGRNADCTVCHAPGAPSAEAHLAGLPDAWRPGERYELQAAVTGGPMALPDPQPQGGFELEVEAGTLVAGPGMAGLLRFPQETVATYLPEGTLRREWNIAWNAPDLHEPPAAVQVWLAVVAANGNHVIATNTSDGGEQGDAVASLVATIPPATDVVEAWQALPLLRPVIDRIEETATGVRVIGHHSDGNATHLGIRVAGGPWKEEPTEAVWSLRVNGDLEAIEIRSQGHGRTSPAGPVAPPVAATPLPILVPALALAAVFGWRRTSYQG